MRTSLLLPLFALLAFSSCVDDAGPAEGEGEGAGEGEGEGEGDDTLRFCQERCEQAEDCAFDGDECRDNRCVSPSFAPIPCATDETCLLERNRGLWSSECVVEDDCGVQFTCIDMGDGGGRCAVPAGETLCDVGDGVFVDDVNGNLVEVCGINSVCVDNACVECRAETDCGRGTTSAQPFCRADGNCVQCIDDTGCAGTAYPVCYQQLFCGCSDDEDCLAAEGGGICSVFGNCTGCGNDADCDFATSPGARCLEGAVCGCDSASDCIAEPSGGTTIVCE